MDNLSSMVGQRINITIIDVGEFRVDLSHDYRSTLNKELITDKSYPVTQYIGGRIQKNIQSEKHNFSFLIENKTVGDVQQ